MLALLFLALVPAQDVDRKLCYFRYPRPSPQKAQAIEATVRVMVLVDLNHAQFTGQQRKVAFDQFYALEADALPALVRWMDFCANQHATCPVNMLHAKLGKFVSDGDADTVALIQQWLGKGLRVKDPPEAYKSLRAEVARALKNHRRERLATYKTLSAPEVVERLKVIQKAPRLAEWRVLIEHLGTRKTSGAAFDALLDALAAAKTAGEREAAHAALVEWAGTDDQGPMRPDGAAVDHGPTRFDSAGEAAQAVQRWKAWRKGGR